MAEKTNVPIDRDAPFWPHMFDPFRTFGQAVSNYFSPSADASQGDGSYEITVELPGVKEEDIDVSVHDNMLTVRGEKRQEREEKDEKKQYYFSERMYGSFQRSFRLPRDVKSSDIKAVYDNGVLKLSIPKLRETPSGAQKIKVSKG